MNKFIVGFFAVLLVSRFFSETIGVLPKAVDLLDLIVIPILLLLSISQRPSRDADHALQHRVSWLVVLFVIVCLVSCAVNNERVHFGPVVLFMFGMLEGPLLFIALNKVIHDRLDMGSRVAKFINVIVIVEAAVVVLVNIPVFIATGDPDKVSGTFGNNCYQFSAFLVLMGGYFLGQFYVKGRLSIYGIAIQCFVAITFILLQYRTAMPAFLISYAVLLTVLYGRRFIRMGSVAMVLGLIVYYAFTYISASEELDLKYEDFYELAANPSVLADYGKVKSYFNTADMFSEYPYMVVVGCGPGTYVSRANYTFTNEISTSKKKGVANILRTVFGDKPYLSDVQMQYIQPLYQLESLFGSIQVNNPNSSVLATAAEVGFSGLIIMVLLYGFLTVKALGYLRYAKAVADPVLLPLSTSLVITSLYFVMLSPMDNYIEIARVTLPLWLLFWTVSAMVRQHRVDQMSRMLQHYGEEAYARQISHGRIGSGRPRYDALP